MRRISDQSMNTKLQLVINKLFVVILYLKTKQFEHLIV
jgi:hypothetical protein